jgi:hypothetical protein
MIMSDARTIFAGEAGVFLGANALADAVSVGRTGAIPSNS